MFVSIGSVFLIINYLSDNLKKGGLKNKVHIDNGCAGAIGIDGLDLLFFAGFVTSHFMASHNDGLFVLLAIYQVISAGIRTYWMRKAAITPARPSILVVCYW